MPARRRAAEEWTPLVALQSSGDRPPLFLLPALGGDIRCYADLVQLLGEEQPVYAFRPRGIDQDLPPHVTMDEMIRDYVAAVGNCSRLVRIMWPVGRPAASWRIALVEALERAGEEVALFAMFDAPLPSVFEGVNVDDDAQFLCELVNFASRFSGTDIQIDHDELTKLAPEEQFQFALSEARKTGIVPAETPEAYIRRLVRAGEANVRVLQGFEPGPLTTPIRLFVPTSKTALVGLAGIAPVSDEDRGWSGRDGQVVEIHEVPGDHFTMMLGEGATVIAQHLNKLLAEAQSGDREPQSSAR